MLTIDKEFRKGILFVRLLGVLDKNTVDKLYNEITMLVKDMEIKNVVFNINGLKKIDIFGINEILITYNMCKNNNGTSLLCGINDNLKDVIDRSPIKFIKKISSEINALELIKI